MEKITSVDQTEEQRVETTRYALSIDLNGDREAKSSATRPDVAPTARSRTRSANKQNTTESTPENTNEPQSCIIRETVAEATAKTADGSAASGLAVDDRHREAAAGRAKLAEEEEDDDDDDDDDDNDDDDDDAPQIGGTDKQAEANGDAHVLNDRQASGRWATSGDLASSGEQRVPAVGA